MVNTYDLFISHSWSYHNHYMGLKRLLKQRPYFDFKDHSVPKHDPVHTSGSDKALYEAIYNKMYNCHVVIIMAGVYATYSKWINKEIEIANRFGKPILAVVPRGNVNVSQVVQDNCDEIVNWSTESVVDAIRELVR